MSYTIVRTHSLATVQQNIDVCVLFCDFLLTILTFITHVASILKDLIDGVELGLEDEDIVSAVEIKCVVARAKYNWLKV